MKNGISYFDAHADTISYCAFSGRSLANNELHVDLKRAAEFTAYA